MNAKIWIPLCALAALLSACERREDAAENGNVSVETVPDDPAAPGDQETTPGGVAGETAATPPGTQPAEAEAPPETPTQSPGN
jgi:hypothetical protein